ncbi:tripartite tricarboxylate transporter permease [Nocardia carnea]|uniref:Tripartite tricarboxylate transporter permease n=1 Tax=Nocardia carnea TaxID=37328 RepID=A0ABW7TDP9_9NOCA|nr:tripartite tricarboxylate transporter permease [Nocardia carnea]
MSAILTSDIALAVILAVIGAIVFSLIGMVSGTDETATIAPLTLLVILLGAPPAAVFTFFLSGAVAKHMTHAAPTTLLGIPGDTMAVPLMREARMLRALGVPHIALRKAISAAVIAAVIAVPAAVLFATLLAPVADHVQSAAPWLFLLAAIGIAYASPGKWAGVLALVPFVVLILGLKQLTESYDVALNISYFLGIAVGPLIADLFLSLGPGRTEMARKEPATVWLAPDVKTWKGYFPNPFRILDRGQTGYVAATATVSSATFVFSPVAMTVLMGEMVATRVKHGYRRLTSVIAARNGTTESTYIAEALIPLIAFGLPLSPVAAGPAAPLFNAPPVFTTDDGNGNIDNLSTALSNTEFLFYGLAAVAVAILIAYPFAMNFAHRAASIVVRYVSHEAIIAAFAGLVVVISVWEGGVLGLAVTLTVGLVGGLLCRFFKIHAGVLFMGYYVAVLTIPAVLAL